MDIEKEKIGRLIKQIQGGNNEAFEELYRITSPKAYFVALQIVRNEQDAEDILQETYIKVLEKIDEIDPSQSFMGWIYRVVSNKSKNLLKKKNILTFEAYEEDVFEDVPDERTEFSPEENLNQSEVCREVMAAIDELSDEKRVCIIMKYFGEMTVNEIAESLEAPESTVRNRLFIARKELKNKLGKKESTALYSAAPIGIVIWALGETSKAVSATFAASAASAAVMTSAVSTAGSTSAAATAAVSASSSAAATGTGIAAKAAVISVAQKVAAGVAAASVIGGSTVGVVTVVKNNNTADEITTGYIQVGIYNLKAVNENGEVIQPNEGHTVKIKMAIPDEYKDKTDIVIYHRFVDGGREKLSTADGTLIIENGYMIFEVSKFSEFEILAGTADMTISKLPDKLNYSYKGTLDLNGIELKITDIDGSVEYVTDTSKMTVEGFDSSELGVQTVTVKYEQYSCTFEVTVSYAWWQWIIRILLLGFLWY